MYTGTLIDDLIAAVERAETSPRSHSQQEANLAYWYTVGEPEVVKLSCANALSEVV